MVELPAALAGDDNEINADEDGARRVAMLIGGTALGAGIIAAGGMVYQRAADVLGTEQNVSDLY